ncbi:Beta-parvin [Myotis brandtii]|uniref:Beta-parvin n=1 Tax=Myotis brandtii TaxID=109478 RepID=S7ML04_MYOBR|nr:Beta-parvin [Myotis brandtii]
MDRDVTAARRRAFLSSCADRPFQVPVSDCCRLVCGTVPVACGSPSPLRLPRAVVLRDSGEKRGSRRHASRAAVRALPAPLPVVTDLQEEGKNAINSPMSPALADLHPEDTLLEENEERTMIDPTSKEDPKFKELVKVLIDWINDVLVEDRIIVKQLEEDLFDGQVLQKLLETLAGCKLNVAEVTQSEIGQKQKLQTVLEAVQELLRPHGWALPWTVDETLAGCKLNVAEVTQSEIGQKQKLQTVLEAVQELLRPHGWALPWTVDAIHGKNLVAILHLLVSLATHFRAPIRLPEHVSVQVVVVRKREGLLHSSHVTEELTTTTEQMMGRFGTRRCAQQRAWPPSSAGSCVRVRGKQAISGWQAISSSLVAVLTHTGLLVTQAAASGGAGCQGLLRGRPRPRSSLYLFSVLSRGRAS